MAFRANFLNSVSDHVDVAAMQSPLFAVKVVDLCERGLHKIAVRIPKSLKPECSRNKELSSDSPSTLPMYYDHLMGRLLVASHGGLVSCWLWTL